MIWCLRKISAGCMSHGNELDIWLNLYSVQYLCRVTANGNRKRLCSIKNKILRDLVSNNYSLTHSKHLFLCLRGISKLKKHFPQEKSSLDLILLTGRVGWDESACSINFTGSIRRIRRSIFSLKFFSEISECNYLSLFSCFIIRFYSSFLSLLMF